jgi:hypothetical protein
VNENQAKCIAGMFNKPITADAYKLTFVPLLNDPRLTVVIDAETKDDYRDIIRDFIYQNNVPLYNKLAQHGEFINQHGNHSLIGHQL